MAPYRILSLDGGGCRAIIESTVLARLLEEYPCLLNDVDLFAGASAGSILALCFAAGFSNSEASEFYQRDVKDVFKTSLIREFEELHGSIGAKYSNETLKAMLVKQFGDMRLRDLKRKVFVPAFQLDNMTTPEDNNPDSKLNRRWVPRFFHNLNDSVSLDELVVDIALRSSAAPTYFPVYQGYVDGGVFANNPSLCAVTTALASGIKLEDIVVLSLSTGKDGLYLSEKKVGEGDWGLVQWAPKLTDLILDGGIEVTDFQCAQILGDRYMRVNPPLPKNMPLDCPQQMPQLVQLAQAIDLSPTQEWITKYWHSGEKFLHDGQSTTPTTVPGVKASRYLPNMGCSIM